MLVTTAEQVRVIFFDLGNTLVTLPKKWIQGAPVLLVAWRSAGFRLGIISNTAGLPDRAAILDLLPDDFDLNLFDPTLVLFSSEVGIDKPQKAIFEEAVHRAAIGASQCLYCSESIVETLVAQRVGMLTIRVQASPNNDLGSLASELDRLLSLL